MELYPPSWAFMTRKVDEKGEWYLDFCALRHICNNHVKFVYFRPKIYKFIIVGGNIIRLSWVGSVTLFLENFSNLTFINVGYAPKCDSNLIPLKQLRETGISYYDYTKCMMLKQKGKIIRLVTRRKNLFILNTQIPSKTISVKGRGRPTYRLGSNLQIWLWHRCFGHASNARVIQASRLVYGINLGEIGQVDKLYFFDFESSHSNAEAIYKPASINKTINYNFEDVKKLYEACIESRHTKIVKSKKITPTTKRL